MLKTTVKINHVNNLSVARYCAGMFVDIVGFQIDQTSEFYVPFEKYKEMIGWLSGVKTCLETTSTDFDFIKEAIEIYHPDLLEVTEEYLLNYDFGVEVIFKDKTFQVVDLPQFKSLDQSNLPKISINAPQELRPGFQDFGELMDILELLDAD